MKPRGAGDFRRELSLETTMRHALLICISFGLLAPAMAAELTVLGIKFDSPFDAQTCPTLGVPGGELTVRESAVLATCISPRDVSKWRDGYGEVWVPIEKKPLEISNPMSIRFEGGEPRTMRMKFPGVNANLAVLKMLEEKFGPPTEKRATVKQNTYGAQYSVTEAEWKNEDIEVVLMVTAINSGTVMIIGPSARKAFLEKRRGSIPSTKPGL